MLVIVSDTSPLYYLGTLGRLQLLQRLYGTVLVPPAVDREVIAGASLQPALAAGYREAMADGWLQLRSPQAIPGAETVGLDAGEREAIQLALECGGTLLLDERAGRELAQRLGVAVRGTLGVLLEAKRLGLIPQLGPLLAELARRTSFRATPALLAEVLRLAGEEPNS